MQNIGSLSGLLCRDLQKAVAFPRSFYFLKVFVETTQAIMTSVKDREVFIMFEL